MTETTTQTLPTTEVVLGFTCGECEDEVFVNAEEAILRGIPTCARCTSPLTLNTTAEATVLRLDINGLRAEIERLGGVCVIWTPEDLSEELRNAEQDWEIELDDETRAKIVELAQESWDWNHLADCTDRDWDQVRGALNHALQALNIDELA